MMPAYSYNLHEFAYDLAKWICLIGLPLFQTYNWLFVVCKLDSYTCVC